MFILDLITGKILFTSLFIILIHSIETLAYAVRLSGARVKLIASGLSLFSTIVIVSRMANMGQRTRLLGVLLIRLLSKIFSVLLKVSLGY